MPRLRYRRQPYHPFSLFIYQKLKHLAHDEAYPIKQLMQEAHEAFPDVPLKNLYASLNELFKRNRVIKQLFTYYKCGTIKNRYIIRKSKKSLQRFKILKIRRTLKLLRYVILPLAKIIDDIEIEAPELHKEVVELKKRALALKKDLGLLWMRYR